MHPPLNDPTLLYRSRDAIAAVDALGVAIAHLDLFTSLAAAPADAAGIAARFGLHPRPTDVLCTLLAAQGLLVRGSDARWLVSPTAAEFLVAGTPFDARPYWGAMAQKPGVTDFLRVLRTGRPANWPGEAGEADWHAAMRTVEFAEAFTAAMHCRGLVLAPALAAAVTLGPATRLLDIGGGSGVYALGLAERFPALEATVLEAAPVDAIARRTIAAAGMSARIAVITADMFSDPWPSGHDIHLLSNVLHDWDEPECRDLLARSVASLPAGGSILIHDMLLDDDKAGPLWAAEYSVLLTTVTQGRLYSAAEIGGWLADLGFTLVGPVRPTALGRGLLVATRR